MNKEDVFTKFADKLLSYLDGAELLAKKELPDFIAQFITYETWAVSWKLDIILFVVAILLLLQIGLTIAYFRCRDLTRDGKEFRETAPWMFIGFGVAGTICLFAASGQYVELKKMELAPKVYMIEKAKELLK